MDPTTLAAAARRFPLLGQPGPLVSLFPIGSRRSPTSRTPRDSEGADGLAEGAHVLNKAALVASDCGLVGLARDLCWQHIDPYRVADRPVTVLQARCMLEPVLNLARLQIRASDGEQALRLLKSIYRAIMTNTDLTCARHEHHKLREWVWLHLLGDGIRALALSLGVGTRRSPMRKLTAGVGLHLMEAGSHDHGSLSERCASGGARGAAKSHQSHDVMPVMR